MSHHERTIRDDVIDAINNGILNKDYMISAMLNFLSVDDVKLMLNMNDISLGQDEDECEDEDEDECEHTQI